MYAYCCYETFAIDIENLDKKIIEKKKNIQLELIIKSLVNQKILLKKF